MTRFARAKGSKASNERLPDEPTPWHLMKQQLEDAVSFKEIQQKSKSAKELLKEKDDPYYCDTTGNVNNDWAEFEPEKKTKKGKSGKKENNSEEQKENSKVSVDKSVVSNDKKLKKRKSDVIVEDSSKNSNEADSAKSRTSSPGKNEGKELQNKEVELGTGEDSLKKCEQSEKKKDKKRAKKPKNEKLPDTQAEIVSEVVSEQGSPKGAQKIEGKLSKRQKRNRKNKSKSEGQSAPNEQSETSTTPATFNTEGNDWSSNVKFGSGKPLNQNIESDNRTNKGLPNSQDKDFANNQNDDCSKRPFDRFNNKPEPKKRKPPKVRDEKEHKRRKPNPGSQKVIINGMEVEIVQYDGFPVKKEDADRLYELRQQMVMKGIPKKEMEMAMKLERRKAEKALTRIKKNVCFHCRKAGHNLSDCPELGKEEIITGICFKCGSTEHTHFECKVNKKEEFRFASCFICREQGHIAKQCPDNPKGLYPQGGACKVCGDVTHLKKDCPDLTKEKEENTLTLDTIASSNLESLDDSSNITSSEPKKLKKTPVKF